MAYEAMLAGLEMTPFRGGITVRDLEPTIRKESMTRFYMLLEKLPFIIKWENHSKSRPPLLELEKPRCQPPRRTSKEPRATIDFSRSALASFYLASIFSLIRLCRAWHRKCPRQIYDHQKLHLSVFPHNGSSNNASEPFAHLPESWANDSGWTRILKLFRDQGGNIRAEAIDAFDRSADIQVLPPAPETRPETSSRPILIAPPLVLDRTLVSPSVQALREAVEIEPAHPDVLPPKAMELDLLDCDAIPALIAGVLRGTNVREFLERLGVLACTGMCSDFMCIMLPIFPYDMFQERA
jgi:hypothetical protein